MADPVLDALTSLREKLEALDAERERLQQAIAALEALGDAKRLVRRTPSYDPTRPSVRTMAVELLEEEDRDWSAGEIISAYQRRGTPVHGQDPSNALRAALADAKKRGLIIRTEVGRYKATKWSEQTPPPVEEPRREEDIAYG